MIDLVLKGPDVAAFSPTLLSGGQEGCVVLFTRSVARENDSPRLLAYDFVVPEPVDYLRRGPLEAELAPTFVATVSKRAKVSNQGLVFVHSHPGTSPPRFSQIDDQGEAHLARFLARRLPDQVHLALVISQGGACARELGSKRPVRVVEVGSKRRVLSEVQDPVGWTAPPEFDRQVRAFGSEGQRELGDLRVGIVGVGGTGSFVAQELAYLGVRHFVIIDADTVDLTNLNRLAGATRDDIGKNKSDVAKGHVQRIAPQAKIEAVVGDVMHASVARRLASLDIIFGCTDSHGSRSVLQQVSYQYLVPCIDMGVTIVASNGALSHVYGRIQLLAPGYACLTCSGLLDPDQIRRDMMTPLERRADPYIAGAAEPAPAVMSLNGTVASLAVTMFLSVVTAFPENGRHLLYNALATSLRVVAARQRPDCFICSTAGVLALGDSNPLMARQD